MLGEIKERGSLMARTRILYCQGNVLHRILAGRVWYEWYSCHALLPQNTIQKLQLSSCMWSLVGLLRSFVLYVCRRIGDVNGGANPISSKFQSLPVCGLAIVLERLVKSSRPQILLSVTLCSQSLKVWKTRSQT